MKTSFLFVLAFYFLAHATAQPRLTEVGMDAAVGRPGIPFKKLRLPNGLTVVLVENHSNPRVIVDVVYKVGSAQDPESKSGMAHFFEHLMFKGSRHVPDGGHNRLLAEVGGTANAQTFADKTVFKNNAPGNALQRILWLEADRMGGWLNAFNRSAFETERKVILNERMQNTDNSAQAETEELTSMFYYPTTYPYRRPGGGFADDIKSVRFEDAVEFYRKYYGPANAILLIGGDFRTDSALTWTSRYFGWIPSGSSANYLVPAAVSSRRIDTVLAVEDRLIDHPFITIKFPSVARYQADFAALECIGRLLGGSQTAFLTASLQKEIPGCAIGAFNYSQKSGGDLSIIANLPQGTSMVGAKEAIFRSIHAFADLPDEELKREVDRFKKWVVFRKLFEAENMDGKIFNLMQYEIMLGKADYFSRELQTFEQLTAADVRAAFRHYILAGHCLVAMAEPSTTGTDLKDFYARREALSRAATIEEEPKLGLGASAKGTLSENAPDTFDRSGYPPLDKARFAYNGGSRRWAYRFPNSISAIGEEDKATPVVSIDVYRKNPGVSATDLTELAFILQSCPSKHYSAAELTRMIDDCGAYYYCAIDDNSIILQIKCLRKYLDTALVWLQEKLLYPVVTDSVYNLARSRIHRGEMATSVDVNDLASTAFKSLGDDPTYRLPDTSIDRLTAHFPKGKAAAILSSTDPRSLEVVCYGPITAGDLVAKVSFLSSLVKLSEPAVAGPAITAGASPGVYCFDVAGATQVAIRCGFDLLPANCPDTDLYRLSFANYIFGGFFNSRLNTDLREKKGYTYRAFSYLTTNPGHISNFIEVNVPAADLSKALLEIMHQVDSFAHHGISVEETKFLQTAFAFSNPLLNEFYYDKMKFLMLVGAGELREDIDGFEHSLMDTLTDRQLTEVVHRLVDPSRFRIILAGDGKSIATSLSELKTEPSGAKIRLDNYEFPIFIR